MGYLPSGIGLAVGQSAVNVPVEYQGLITQTTQQYNLPNGLLASIIANESSFNPNAVSNVGAQGIAQFMPGTASALGINPWDPNQAIPAAGQYLSELHAEMQKAFPLATPAQLWQYTIAAYNAGPGNVQKYGGIPPFAETKNYLQNITAGMGLNNISELPGSFGSSSTNTNTTTNTPSGGSSNTQTTNNSSSTSTDNPYVIETPVGDIDYSSLIPTAQSFAINAGLITLAIALISGGILWLAQSSPTIVQGERDAGKAAETAAVAA